MKFPFDYVNYGDLILNQFKIVLPRFIPTIEPILIEISGKEVIIKTDELDEQYVYEYLMIYANGFLKGTELQMIKEFNDGHE